MSFQRYSILSEVLKKGGGFRDAFSNCLLFLVTRRICPRGRGLYRGIVCMYILYSLYMHASRRRCWQVYPHHIIHYGKADYIDIIQEQIDLQRLFYETSLFYPILPLPCSTPLHSTPIALVPYSLSYHISYLISQDSPPLALFDGGND